MYLVYKGVRKVITQTLVHSTKTLVGDTVTTVATVVIRLGSKLARFSIFCVKETCCHCATQATALPRLPRLPSLRVTYAIVAVLAVIQDKPCCGKLFRGQACLSALELTFINLWNVPCIELQPALFLYFCVKNTHGFCRKLVRRRCRFC